MKKRILFSVVLFFSLFLVEGQVIYKNNFDMAGGAELFDSDSDGFAWTLFDYADGEGMVVTSNNQFSTQPNRADNWLVCKAIDLSQTHRPHVFWKAKVSGSENADEKLTVYVSTASSLPNGVTSPIDVETSAELQKTFTISASNAYQNLQIDISELKGKDSVYVAFRHQNSSAAFGLNLDDLVVSDVVNPALDVSIVPPSIAYLSADNTSEFTFFKALLQPNSTIPLSFKIGNYGSIFSGGKFQLTINGDVSTEPISSGLSLNEFFRITTSGLGEGRYEIAAKVLDDSGQSVSETATYKIEIARPIPDVNLTDTNGNSYNLYDELRKGKTILLDFFASWCGPCEDSTPEINRIWDRFGRGKSSFQVFGITTHETDTDAVIDNLPWGAEYPKFSYSETGVSLYSHLYTLFRTGDGIPYFFMICPNTEHPGFSEITVSVAGWYGEEYMTQQALSCNPRLSVNDLDKPRTLSLYPNPAMEQTHLELNLPTSDEVVIQVYNNLGQSVYSKNLIMGAGEHSLGIPLEGLQSGLHFVQVKTNHQIYLEKLNVVK